MERTGLGIFGRLASAVLARPGTWAVVILGFTVVMGVLASRIRVDPNILELLPEDDPTTLAIQKLNEQEGGTNLLTISISSADGEGAELSEFMLELRDELETHDDVEYVLYDLDPELLRRIGLMRYEADEFSDVMNKLIGILSRAPLGAANMSVGGFGGPAAGPSLEDRKAELDTRAEEFEAAFAQVDEQSTPFLKDGTARLLVRPIGSAYDPDFSRPFMADVYQIIDDLDPESRGLEVAWVGGAYRHAVEDLENVIHDLTWTAIVSLGLVLVFLGVAFRDAKAVLLLFLPLVIGNVWTLGYASVSVGTLNTFTSFVAAILIGLGVDFSIHLYSRYREERIDSDTIQEAVIRAWDHAGPPCMTAAITSAGGFCALWAAGFQGFQQLGTLLAGGVLLCLIAVLLVLPLLILWREKGAKPVPLRVLSDTGEKSQSRYRFAPLGMVAIALVTVVAVLQVPKVEFEYDISELRARGLSYSDLDEETRSHAQDSYAPIVISYPDDASLRTAHQAYQNRVDDCTAIEQCEVDGVGCEAVSANLTCDLAYVGQVLSVYSLVPLEQAEQSRHLKEFHKTLEQNKKFLIHPIYENLVPIVDRLAAIDADPVEAADLPEGFQRWLSPGDGSSHRLMLIPKGNMWNIKNNVSLQEEVAAFSQGGEAAGEYLAMAVLYRLVEGDAPRVAGLAFLAVLFFALVDLRKPLLAIGAVLALASGMAWAGAGMAGFGIKLSLVNFVGIPILMGIGVDVIIHLMHRIREEGKGRVRWALKTTGWACGLSAATTILSFASLSVAEAQGVRSLGTMIVLGLFLVTLAAFLVIPTGQTASWRLSRSKQRGDGESV